MVIFCGINLSQSVPFPPALVLNEIALAFPGMVLRIV
jgi:hypothetical protein